MVCIRKLKSPKRSEGETYTGKDKRKQRQGATGSVIASRDVPCVQLEGGDGVGGKAEQTQMPGGG